MFGLKIKKDNWLISDHRNTYILYCTKLFKINNSYKTLILILIVLFNLLLVVPCWILYNF